MALTPPTLYSHIASARNAGQFSFSGVPFDALAWSIAYGVNSWLPTGTALVGVSVGSAGVGAINVPTSRLFLAPNAPLVLSGLKSAGLDGPLSFALSVVVSQGLSQAVGASGQYAGVVAGVGSGVDTSKVVRADGPALASALDGFMSSLLGVGPARKLMAQGLGTGIASLFLGITGQGSVVGSSSPFGASGQSNSVVV